MAGRGRGGMRPMSFDIDSLGFGRGEALPGPILQPPAIFPPLELKPVPLQNGEEYDYLLALKQEYRGTMRESPYFMKLPDRKKDIARYSDKYALSQHDNHTNWKPAWIRIPQELQIRAKTRTKVKAIIKPKIPTVSKDKAIPEEEITKTLEELEKKEETEEGGKEQEEDKDEELEEEEYYDEEDIDDTDYNQNYFDNGENYGLDEDEEFDEGPLF